MRFLYMLCITVLLFSCKQGNTKVEKEAKQTTQKMLSGETQNDDASACDILTEDIAKSLFPNATTWRIESNEGSYPMCYRYFDDDKGNGGLVGITMAKGSGSKDNFATAMSYLKMKKEKVNLGNEAYYMPQMNQLSVWIENDIIHAIVNKNGKGNKEKAIQLIHKIYK